VLVHLNNKDDPKLILKSELKVTIRPTDQLNMVKMHFWDIFLLQKIK